MGLYTRDFINGVITKLRTAWVNKRGEGGGGRQRIYGVLR